MMNTRFGREWQLRRRPTGLPTDADVALVGIPVGGPAAGQVVVRNRALSVEPSMWGRMTGESDYTTPFGLDEPMSGHAVGEFVASAAPNMPECSIVLHENGTRGRNHGRV